MKARQHDDLLPEVYSLTARIRNCAVYEGKTIAELAAMDMRELRLMPNLGRKSIDLLHKAYPQAGRRWYVVAEDPDADPSDRVWTVSRQVDEAGWNTDGGHEGYGLTKAQATELADGANSVVANRKYWKAMQAKWREEYRRLCEEEGK